MYKDKDKQREANRYVYESNAGYIYIIRCVGFHYYKIGRAVNPENRVDSLQIGSPFRLHLEYALFVQDMNEVEAKVQQHYKCNHVRGEWYEFTDGELESVKDEIIMLKDYVYIGESYPAYLRKHPKTAKQYGFGEPAGKSGG